MYEPVGILTPDITDIHHQWRPLDNLSLLTLAAPIRKSHTTLLIFLFQVYGSLFTLLLSRLGITTNRFI
jgi:hypothetical protein